MNDAKLHMLKIQKLMIDQFGVEARANDMLAEMSDLASKLVHQVCRKRLILKFVSSPTLTHIETIAWPSSEGHVIIF